MDNPPPPPPRLPPPPPTRGVPPPFPPSPLPRYPGGPPGPPPRRGKSGWLGLGAFLALLASKLKFLLPALKFLPFILKTGGSMLLMVGIYTMMFGWQFAVGFVLLLFVHEMGHIAAARRCGIKVSVPFFIPFVGALIMLKEMPKNAWTEARIAVGGPMLGAIGAAACHALYVATGHPLLLVLAYFGYWLNLFNLAPVGFLDGGRIVTAISPWMWLVGFSALATMTVWRFRASESTEIFIEHNFILLLVLFFSVPRLLWLFRRNKSPEQLRYFEVTNGQRWTMAILYFGLAGLLAAGMFYSRVGVDALHQQ